MTTNEKKDKAFYDALEAKHVAAHATRLAEHTKLLFDTMKATFPNLPVSDVCTLTGAAMQYDVAFTIRDMKSEMMENNDNVQGQLTEMVDSLKLIAQSE